MSYKLKERTNTIEDLMEQKEYLKTIPDMVTSHQSRIDQAMSDYDMIDDYYYTLSNEDFNNRSAPCCTCIVACMYIACTVHVVHLITALEGKFVLSLPPPSLSLAGLLCRGRSVSQT